MKEIQELIKANNLTLLKSIAELHSSSAPVDSPQPQTEQEKQIPLKSTADSRATPIKTKTKKVQKPKEESKATDPSPIIKKAIKDEDVIEEIYENDFE